MFTLAFDVVVETMLVERWMVLRLSEYLVLRVVKDGKLDAITSRHSVEDVRPLLCVQLQKSLEANRLLV
jgi:hypothetical protein